MDKRDVGPRLNGMRRDGNARRRTAFTRSGISFIYGRPSAVLNVPYCRLGSMSVPEGAPDAVFSVSGRLWKCAKNIRDSYFPQDCITAKKHGNKAKILG